MKLRPKSKPPVPSKVKSQRTLDLVALADAREGIRQGLEDSRLGKTRPVREFFAEFEVNHGIHR